MAQWKKREMMADGSGRLNATAAQRWLATAWMMLGTIALALAGIFAILLVVARIPGTEVLFPTQDFFRVALIVHVDQSVLIWFLAISGMVWSLADRVPLQTTSHGPGVSFVGIDRSRADRHVLPQPTRIIAFIAAAVGCLLVAVSPFLGAGAPLLNNYVPVLDHSLFLVAIGLFGIGVLVQVVLSLARSIGALNFGDPLRVGAFTAAIAALLAGISLLWTWADLDPAWEGKAYYEYLFWGPGHILQFAYTQIMLVAWIWLARATGRPLPLSDAWLSALLVLGVLPLLTVPLIHGLHAPDSAQIRIVYTHLMQYGNALAPVPIGLLLTLPLIRNRGREVPPEQRPVHSALLTSLVLFAVGGLIGTAISGSNTIVPAHYHGSIVGVTLALMGLTYHLLPELGFARPTGRMACWQARVYGFGQLLHIAGLAVSGAMGIQRKTAGAAQELDGLTRAFMGVMGVGGLLAVIGGILFVLVVMRACSHRVIR